MTERNILSKCCVYVVVKYLLNCTWTYYSYILFPFGLYSQNVTHLFKSFILHIYVIGRLGQIEIITYNMAAGHSDLFPSWKTNLNKRKQHINFCRYIKDLHLINQIDNSSVAYLKKLQYKMKLYG